MTNFKTGKKKAAARYGVGHYDLRPWGFWVVTDAPAKGEAGFCEKIIAVAPGRVLSLQSHRLRRERWTVLAGSLWVVVGDESFVLAPGGQVDIPRGAVHCMANLGGELCIVKERQTGVCIESDIVRHMDAYGRAEGAGRERRIPGMDLYLDILEKVEGRRKQYA